jgi:hypothetical protein
MCLATALVSWAEIALVISAKLNAIIIFFMVVFFNRLWLETKSVPRFNRI